MTDTTSKLMDGLQRSWLLKLVWVAAPLAPLTIIAVSKNYDGPIPDFFYGMSLWAVVGALAFRYALGFFERRKKRTRLRGLSPLQRLQAYDELDPIPLSEFLGVGQEPPVETLPHIVQIVIARWGAPTHKVIDLALIVLGLSNWIAFCAMACLSDPLGFLSRHLGAPVLPYWPVFVTSAALSVIFLLRARLRHLHRQYVAEAETSGRGPFPAL